MKHAKLGLSMALTLGIGSMSAATVMAQGVPTDAPPRIERKVFVEIRSKDGMIDKSEATGPLKDHFDEIDTNKDGKLSHDELVAYHVKNGPPDGAPGRECRDMIMMVSKDGEKVRRERPFPPGGPMALLDKNADGKLSRDEFLKGQAEMFDRMDANKDGFLTPEERPPHRPGGGCPPPGDMPPPLPR